MSGKNLFFLLFSLPLFSSSQQVEFLCSGFSGGESINISINGIAEIENGGILRLTSAEYRLIGRAFYPKPLRFKKTSGEISSFSTAFAFSIVPEYPKLGGHGFAFVLSPTENPAGALPSQYLGLLNPVVFGQFSNHLIAVEFDTVQDFEFFDINDNHVGIDINSLISSNSASASYYDSDSGKDQPLDLKSGAVIQTWIDYDGGAKVLNVTLSPSSTKPALPLLSFLVDLSTFIEDEMFMGFSAATGLLSSSHYLLGWSFNMNGEAHSLDLSSLPTLPHDASKSKKGISSFAVTVSLSGTIIILIVAAGITALSYRIKNADLIEPWEMEYGPHRFSYSELRQATEGFRDQQLLGFGGFGKVYRGVLSSGGDIAVKRISTDSRQGIREFVAEIASIGRLRHRHLVHLKGWGRRRGDLLLVYEFMANGSLDNFLFSDESRTLTWAQRFGVLRGVASALVYLHEGWERVVIHRDVKASNVLLDANLDGRLGDFGFAKLQEHGANPSTTRVVGTLGYLAPELTRTGKATTKSDVYAYGALVLEVVCGRKPIEPKAMPEELILVDWVFEMWEQGRWTEIVDQRLVGDGYDAVAAEVAVKVGMLCSQHVAAVRPTMREVAMYLDVCDVRQVPDVFRAASTVSPLPKKIEVVEEKITSEDFVLTYPPSFSGQLPTCILTGNGGMAGVTINELKDS